MDDAAAGRISDPGFVAAVEAESADSRSAPTGRLNFNRNNRGQSGELLPESQDTTSTFQGQVQAPEVLLYSQELGQLRALLQQMGGDSGELRAIPSPAFGEFGCG